MFYFLRLRQSCAQKNTICLNFLKPYDYFYTTKKVVVFKLFIFFVIILFYIDNYPLLMWMIFCQEPKASDELIRVSIPIIRE
jgi:hypothetical protein